MDVIPSKGTDRHKRGAGRRQYAYNCPRNAEHGHLNRLYRREKGKSGRFIPVGWTCSSCGYISLEV